LRQQQRAANLSNFRVNAGTYHDGFAVARQDARPFKNHIMLSRGWQIIFI
jgi:hypothetical protein